MYIVDEKIENHPLLVVYDWMTFPFSHGFLSATLDINQDIKHDGINEGVISFERLISHAFGCQTQLLRVKQVHDIDLVEMIDESNCRPIFCLHKNSVACKSVLSIDSLRMRQIEADGWIVNTDLLIKFGLTVGIATADCMPIIGYCQANKLSFVLHCGFRSTVAGLLTITLKRMAELGSPLETVQLAIGPGASFARYEVDDSIADNFNMAVAKLNIGQELNCCKTHIGRSLIRKSTSPGKSFVNMSGLLELQALELGILPSSICIYPGCTIADPNFFSYRRQGEEAGRQLSFVSGYTRQKSN